MQNFKKQKQTENEIESKSQRLQRLYFKFKDCFEKTKLNKNFDLRL